MNFIKTALAAVVICSIANTIDAQEIKGQIMSADGSPLVGASVVESGTQNGAVTDLHGYFSLQVVSLPVQLIASFVGFKSDTLTVKSTAPLVLTLEEASEEIGEVVVESSSTFFDPLSPIMNEVLTEAELEKAAC